MSTTNITLQISQPDPLEIAKITPFFPTETQGEPGETPMLRMLAQALQWKYVSEGNGAYQTLFDFDDLELPISQITALQTALDSKLPTSYVPVWDDVSGKPSTFTPSTHAHAIADTTGLQTALDAKAPQSTTDTKTEVDNKIAAAIANLINSAPGALDTLDELAAAMGDDPNFAATIVNSLAGKVALAGSYADPTWITSLAASKIDQSDSYRFVTDTEKITWNAKQDALSGGTTNRITKWTGTGAIGISSIFDNGTNVGIGNTNTSYAFDVTGIGRFSAGLNVITSGTQATSTSLFKINADGGFGANDLFEVFANGDFQFKNKFGANLIKYSAAEDFLNATSTSFRANGINSSGYVYGAFFGGKNYSDRQLNFETSGVSALFTTQRPADKMLVVRGYTSHTGNLTEWQNSGGTALSVVKSDGKILVKTSTEAGFDFDVNGTARIVGALTLGSGSGYGTISAPNNYTIRLQSAHSTYTGIELRSSGTTSDGSSGILFNANGGGLADFAVYGASYGAPTYAQNTVNIRNYTNYARYFKLISYNGSTNYEALVVDYNTYNAPIFNFNGDTKSQKFFVSALNTAPSSASDTGTAGELRFTSTAIYICTATNTWKKADIATW